MVSKALAIQARETVENCRLKVDAMYLKNTLKDDFTLELIFTFSSRMRAKNIKKTIDNVSLMWYNLGKR